MDAVLRAPVATLVGARSLPVTLPTVLVGAACIALAVWLVVISRWFGGRHDPPSARARTRAGRSSPVAEGEEAGS